MPTRNKTGAAVTHSKVGIPKWFSHSIYHTSGGWSRMQVLTCQTFPILVHKWATLRQLSLKITINGQVKHHTCHSSCITILYIVCVTSWIDRRVRTHHRPAPAELRRTQMHRMLLSTLHWPLLLVTSIHSYTPTWSHSPLAFLLGCHNLEGCVILLFGSGSRTLFRYFTPTTSALAIHTTGSIRRRLDNTLICKFAASNEFLSKAATIQSLWTGIDTIRNDFDLGWEHQ